MRDLLDDIERWNAAGRNVMVARVVNVEGSGPRLAGAAMAVNETGEVSGSVSGGCIEGAVVTEALRLLPTGSRRLVSFGHSDDEAFAVGLTCGGTIQLFIEPFTGFEPLVDALRREEPVALATIVDGPGIGAKMIVRSGAARHGTLGDPDLDRVVGRDAAAELAAATSAIRHYGPHGEAREDAVTVFIESFAAPPRMVIFGAVDFTAALARAAKLLGYRVTVCDARETFATRQRFPMADEVVVDWPQRFLERIGAALGPRDAVCVLTHDHKFDVPAIRAALATDVGYIGAMGSRRTHAERLARLREVGVDEVALERVMAPIGLDIGARTPEETAISICAEIIRLRSGRSGCSLRDTDGAIH
ncbi:MAG: XdhC family protein [Acidimicrobiales bacterium]|nr:XdhC family protein [Acidimicrobiales bacterium]